MSATMDAGQLPAGDAATAGASQPLLEGAAGLSQSWAPMASQGGLPDLLASWPGGSQGIPGLPMSQDGMGFMGSQPLNMGSLDPATMFGSQDAAMRAAAPMGMGTMPTFPHMQGGTIPVPGGTNFTVSFVQEQKAQPKQIHHSLLKPEHR